jgi:hypothetical protein
MTNIIPQSPLAAVKELRVLKEQVDAAIEKRI